MLRSVVRIAGPRGSALDRFGHLEPTRLQPLSLGDCPLKLALQLGELSVIGGMHAHLLVERVFALGKLLDLAFQALDLLLGASDLLLRGARAGSGRQAPRFTGGHSLRIARTRPRTLRQVLLDPAGHMPKAA